MVHLDGTMDSDIETLLQTTLKLTEWTLSLPRKYTTKLQVQKIPQNVEDVQGWEEGSANSINFKLEYRHSLYLVQGTFSWKDFHQFLLTFNFHCLAHYIKCLEPHCKLCILTISIKIFLGNFVALQELPWHIFS